MRHNRFSILIALYVTVCGCAHPPTGATRISWNQQGEAWQFSNGIVDVVIVPATGRVMCYGLRDGENVLFVDPKNAANAPDGRYHNWGGDKAWLWPQDDWKKLAGRPFPPPPAMDGLTWTCEPVSAREGYLRSGVIEPWGVRIERRMQIEKAGTKVTWTNRLIATDDRPRPPTAVWCVTQTPLGGPIRTRVLPGTPSSNVYRPLMHDPWPQITRDGEWLTFPRNPAGLCKAGVEADEIEVDIGRVTFSQKLFAPPSGYYEAMERCQLFTFPDPGGDHVDQVPYVELEFTSPRSNAAGLAEAGMTVVWELKVAGGTKIN